MSALYVDAVFAPVALRLDGPSLLLEREGRAADRVPFRRLSRLVLRGPAALRGDVVPALLRAGIPVTWLDGRGNRLGTCLPAHARRTDTAALVSEADRAGILDEIRTNWLAAEERQLLLDLVIELGIRRPDLRRTSFDRRLMAALERTGCPLDAEEILARLRALLEAHLVLLLQREGLGFRFQGGDPEGWNLLADLGDVDMLALAPVALDLALYVTRHPGRHNTPGRIMRRFARRYEREAPQIEALVNRQLARLRRVIRERLA